MMFVVVFCLVSLIFNWPLEAHVIEPADYYYDYEDIAEYSSERELYMERPYYESQHPVHLVHNDHEIGHLHHSSQESYHHSHHEETFIETELREERRHEENFSEETFSSRDYLEGVTSVLEEEWIEEFERNERASGRERQASAPVQESPILVPVKGKVTIVGNFGNCQWNAPFPLAPFGPVVSMGPVAPMGTVAPMGQVAPIGPVAPAPICDVDYNTAPVQTKVQASGKVTIAAHFNC